MMVRLRQTPTRKSGNRYALQDLARPPRLSSTLLLRYLETCSGFALLPPGRIDDYSRPLVPTQNVNPARQRQRRGRGHQKLL
jgi:hypothetical protein